MVPAVEVMLNQGLVRELILKGKISKISEVMEQNTTLGMCTFDQSLMRHYADGLISEETAIMNSDKPSDFKVRLQQFKMKAKDGDKGGALSELDTSFLSIRD